jgi:hypothetical protein
VVVVIDIHPIVNKEEAHLATLIAHMDKDMVMTIESTLVIMGIVWTEGDFIMINTIITIISSLPTFDHTRVMSMNIEEGKVVSIEINHPLLICDHRPRI